MVCLGKVGQRGGEAAAGVPVFVPSAVHRHVAPRPPNVPGLPLQHLRVGTTLHHCSDFVRQHEVTPPIVTIPGDNGASTRPAFWVHPCNFVFVHV
jgi:hypothetical protein